MNFFRKIKLQSLKYRQYHGNSPSFRFNEGSVLTGLIAINGAVFVAWKISENDYQLQSFLTKNFTVSSHGVFHFHRYHTLFTAMFSQKDLGHFAFNMITLYSFGGGSLAILGARRFLQLYLGGGLVSTLCQVTWPYIIPRHWPARRYYNEFVPGLGASGAVNAVIIWNILTYPRNIIILFPGIPVPAALLGLGIVGMDAYSLYQGNSSVGNAAHLGGAAFGMLMFAVFRRRI
jgi:membrane associated rhomboid family serine protease